MAVDIGPKIGIEGEREFRYQINQTNQALKTLAAEERAIVSAFDDEADAAKKAAAQKDVLNRQIETQRDKLKLLEEGLQKSAQMYGESDTRTMKWQEAVHNATTTLNKMESELVRVDNGVDEATDSLEAAGGAATSWADVMKGSLCADIVKAGLQKTVELVQNITSAFWDASKAGAAYADEINTLAATSGLATDTIQEYRYMAELIDVSVDTITGSLTKLTSSMNKARDGEGDAAEAFKQLGVAIKDQNGQLRKNSDVFNDVIDAMGGIGNETERDAIAMTIFGKSAKDLNPLIAAGADKLRDLAQEAHDTGYVLDGAALEALNRQQDAMDRFAKKTETVGNAFATKMAPGIEKAYDTMGDVFDNPRVQRGLDLVATGIGTVISKAADLASSVLPNLFSVFSFGDERLRLYNDEQLEIVNRGDKIIEAHQDMIAEFRGNATEIVDEAERTKALWKELQTLTDENGYVKTANHDRAQVLITELNEALGKEYELNGNIITQYQDMQKEIDGLIKKQEAEALIAAGKNAFAEADTRKNEMLQAAADLVPQIEAAARAYEIAGRNYAKAKEYADSKYGNTEEDEDKRLRYLQKYEKELNKTKDTLEGLQGEYENYSSEAQAMFAEVEKWQKAQEAAARRDYDAVVSILTAEFDVALEYYLKKTELNEKEKKDLSEKIATMERRIREYKKNLDEGLAGFSEAGLKELQDYVDEAKRILDGKAVADFWVSGLIKGLNNKENLDKIEKATYTTANTIVKTTKVTMQVKSPSQVAAWIGEMWDAGLIKGIEDRQTELAKAAEGLADTIITSSTPTGAAAIGYGNALTAAPAGGYGGGTSSYTTNLGGITVTVDGAGAVNEDVLAQRIAVQLTDQLQRAQRGGRR